MIRRSLLGLLLGVLLCVPLSEVYAQPGGGGPSGGGGSSGGDSGGGDGPSGGGPNSGGSDPGSGQTGPGQIPGGVEESVVVGFTPQGQAVVIKRKAKKGSSKGPDYTVLVGGVEIPFGVGAGDIKIQGLVGVAEKLLQGLSPFEGMSGTEGPDKSLGQPLQPVDPSVIDNIIRSNPCFEYLLALDNLDAAQRALEILPRSGRAFQDANNAVTNAKAKIIEKKIACDTKTIEDATVQKIPCDAVKEWIDQEIKNLVKRPYWPSSFDLISELEEYKSNNCSPPSEEITTGPKTSQYTPVASPKVVYSKNTRNIFESFLFKLKDFFGWSVNTDTDNDGRYQKPNTPPIPAQAPQGSAEQKAKLCAEVERLNGQLDVLDNQLYQFKKNLEFSQSRSGSRNPATIARTQAAITAKQNEINALNKKIAAAKKKCDPASVASATPTLTISCPPPIVATLDTKSTVSAPSRESAPEAPLVFTSPTKERALVVTTPTSGGSGAAASSSNTGNPAIPATAPTGSFETRYNNDGTTSLVASIALNTNVITALQLLFAASGMPQPIDYKIERWSCFLTSLNNQPIKQCEGSAKIGTTFFEFIFAGQIEFPQGVKIMLRLQNGEWVLVTLQEAIQLLEQGAVDERSGGMIMEGGVLQGIGGGGGGTTFSR